MHISALFIQRPIGTSLLALGVFCVGVLAYFNLAVAPLPKLDFPTIQVGGSLPGASPETMASAVATPLERRFGRIAGITEITSTSSLGTTNLTLQFDLDRDIDAAARDVQAAINAASGELPSNLPTRPTYRKVNPADAPILVLTLTSTTINLSAIYDAANSILAQKISQVEGVGQVFIGGGQQPAVRVQADPQALASYGLTLADVRNMLRNANVKQPVGSLQSAQQAYALDTDDQLVGAAQYAALVLTSQSGAQLHLSDVAQVFDDIENNKVAAWCDGKRAVTMIIRREPGANIIATIDRVKSLLPLFAQSISPAINIDVAVDRAQTIRAAVQDVQGTLILTVVLVVLVVFVFLRSLRATCIPSVAVPLSLLGTFGLMYLLDYSLNNLTLMALTISTGFVVDDAIVVTENIARYLEMGKTPYEAALQGAQQVGFTVLSITVSLLAVFIPVLLMGGVVGRLFHEFAVTLSLSIAVSAVVSLTVTPMMCAVMLRHVPHTARGRLFHASERMFQAWLTHYEHGLRWALRHQRFMLLLSFATVALTVYLFAVIPKGLFPQQDTGLITGATEGAQDISFAMMKKLQLQVNALAHADADVEHTVSFIGSGSGSATNTGTLFMSLKPRLQRQASADAIVNRLRPKMAKLVGVTTYLQAAQDLRIGGRAARTQYQYTLQAADLANLRHWAPRVLAKFKSLPQLKDVATDQQTAGLQANLQIDRDVASRFAISPKIIDDALYDAFGQRIVSTMFTQLGQYRVILEVVPKAQMDRDSLQGLFVAGSSGFPVPIGVLSAVNTSPTPLAINHQGQFPAVTLSFNLAPQVALGQAVDAINAAQAAIGLPPTVRAGFAGTAQAFGASSRNQPVLIMAALLTVYLVLGILYESFVHPITILSTLPSAGVGALLALLLCGIDFGVIALIGIILLIGIVKKNAIMMVDFALELQRESALNPQEAILQACLLRFRPIMMTTLAALFGGLPLALGSGTGAELRQPLGVAIVGGLIISQMLTLYTTPIVYLALERGARWLPRRIS